MRPTPPGRTPNKGRVTLLTLYAHPFELATAVILGVSAVSSGLDPTILDDVLTPGLVAVWVIANTVGIIGIVAGLFGSADLTGSVPRRRAFFRAVEKAGLYLVAATTLGLTVSVEARLPVTESWNPSTQLVAIALACIFRAGAIRKAERIQLEELRRLTATEYLDAIRNATPGRHDDEGGRP